MTKKWHIDPGGTLMLVQGDLTRADTRAIVNAANARLAGGGGVDGAIHRAAGPELPKACQAIIARQGIVPPGGAVLTPGFDLPAEHIIHTVGPIWQGGSANEAPILMWAYQNCLKLAKDTGIPSIAFPAISCGAYGFPEERAAAIALKALCAGLEQGQVELAAMYLHGDESWRIWNEAALSLLGPSHA